MQPTPATPQTTLSVRVVSLAAQPALPLSHSGGASLKMPQEWSPANSALWQEPAPHGFNTQPGTLFHIVHVRCLTPADTVCVFCAAGEMLYKAGNTALRYMYKPSLDGKVSERPTGLVMQAARHSSTTYIAVLMPHAQLQGPTSP